MANSDQTCRLTAAEVLQRYKDKELPAFVEIDLRDVNRAGNFGELPLEIAAVRGNIEELLALLEGGVDVNAQGESGHTALNAAVGQGHLEAVRLLLSYAASPNIPNEWGRTPFDTARNQGLEDILRVLETGGKGSEK